MHAPTHACQKLYRLHPYLRLAWAGRKPKYQGELNPGSFAIVQLYHSRDAGTPDNPTSFKEFWDIIPSIGEDGSLDNIKVDRGPIFNRFGGTTPDWDLERRWPVFVMTVDESYKYPWGEPMQTEDVFTGKFIVGVKHFLRPVFKRMYESRKQYLGDLNCRMEDLGMAATEFLWKKANATGETTPLTTKEERIRAVAEVEKAKGAHTLDSLYRLPKAPKNAQTKEPGDGV